MIGRVHDHAPAEAVGQAFDLLPRSLREIVACEFVIGIDPVFAGIHHYSTASGHAYKDVAHCVHAEHQLHRPRSDRGTKVVLPNNPTYEWGSWAGVHVVIHELGHVLHSRTEPNHIATPVTAYAETDHREAFAEAFAEWIWGQWVDGPTRALFDSLA